MKKVFAKTYTASGTYKNTIENIVFSSFNNTLNSGYGDLSLTVPRRFDEYSINGDLDKGNVIKIYVSDIDADDVLIYSGIIQSNNLTASNNETVTVNCTGYITHLSDDLYEVSKVVYKKFSSMELGAMMKNVIDTYRASRTYPLINYTASSIGNTGITKTQELYLNTYFECINLIAGLGAYNWFWRIDADGIVYYNAFPTTATHIFTQGKDVAGIKIDSNIDTMYNAILITNRLSVNDPEYIFHMVSDATSIATYGRKVKIISDGRYKKSSATYVERANRELAIYKNPINVVEITIIDNNYYNGGYNIESIKVGDTFKLLNVEPNDALTDNMLITNISYNYDSVTLTATDTNTYTSRLLADQKDRMNNNEFSSNLPTTYI